MRILEMSGWQHLVRNVTAIFQARRRRYRPDRHVRFGGRDFSVPQYLADAVLPQAPGIYAIQLRNWWGTMSPVHFGASHNLHEDLTEAGAPEIVHWLSLQDAKRGVFVSFRLAEEFDHHGRHQEGARLNRHYFPQRTHSADEHLLQHRIHRTRHEHRA